jgi:dihydroflavonol-4-reductase
VRVFITGATGFVGSHVARKYASEGASLRLLTRQTSRLDALAGLDAETVVGDLREPEKLRTALSGCDAIVHVAADYRLWVRDPQQMYAANVDGTRELLRLARETGVQRVVYTSSVATMGFKSDGTIVNEDTPVSLADMIGHYKRSKFLGEQEAIKAAKSGQYVMILNPTTPIFLTKNFLPMWTQVSIWSTSPRWRGCTLKRSIMGRRANDTSWVERI